MPTPSPFGEGRYGAYILNSSPKFANPSFYFCGLPCFIRNLLQIISYETFFTNSEFQSSVNFASCQFCRRADFTNVVFENDSDLSDIIFTQDTIFHKTEFKKNVRFMSTVFGDKAIFDKVKFKNNEQIRLTYIIFTRFCFVYMTF